MVFVSVLIFKWGIVLCIIYNFDADDSVEMIKFLIICCNRYDINFINWAQNIKDLPLPSALYYNILMTNYSYKTAKYILPVHSVALNPKFT